MDTPIPEDLIRVLIAIREDERLRHAALDICRLPNPQRMLEIHRMLYENPDERLRAAQTTLKMLQSDGIAAAASQYLATPLPPWQRSEPRLEKFIVLGTAVALVMAIAIAFMPPSTAPSPVTSLPAVPAPRFAPTDNAAPSKPQADALAQRGPQASDTAPKKSTGARRSAPPATSRRKILSQPLPHFPEWVVKEGRIRASFEIVVGPDGRVRKTILVGSSGSGELDRLAENSIRRWIYAPQPGKSETRQVTVNFISGP